MLSYADIGPYSIKHFNSLTDLASSRLFIVSELWRTPPLTRIIICHHEPHQSCENKAENKNPCVTLEKKPSLWCAWWQNGLLDHFFALDSSNKKSLFSLDEKSFICLCRRWSSFSDGRKEGTVLFFSHLFSPSRRFRWKFSWARKRRRSKVQTELKSFVCGPAYPIVPRCTGGRK